MDGRSLWTTHQGEVKGLEAVANDEEGGDLWRRTTATSSPPTTGGIGHTD